MASHSSFSEEDFSCTVCHDIFKHPLVLQCSHSFCKACVQQWWTHKKIKECPICKKISSVNDPPLNLALKNLCESFIQEKRQQVNRKEQREKLKIFNEAKTNCEHIKVLKTETRVQFTVDDPERLDCSFVMGSEAINRGTHSWEVEVGGNRWWTVGAIQKAAVQKKPCRGSRFWRLRLYHGAYIAQSSAGSFTVLSVKQKPRRIRVQLDWNRGTLSFSDPDTDTHIHTFTHTFTGTLFPFIYNCDAAVPLKMVSFQ